MYLTLFNKNKNTPSLLDEFFDSGLWKFPDLRPAMTMLPPANIKESEGLTSIEMMLPGILKNDLKVTVDGNYLNISFEKSTNKDVSDTNYLHKEFEHQSFSRSFRLSSDSEIENIDSKMENGVLIINIPKNHSKSKKLIDIQ